MGKFPTINQRFSSAIQVTEQAQRIAELQTEVERLRSSQSPNLEVQLEILREQLKEHSGELYVEVELIYPNPHQPRQTIGQESIETIARSLERDGQISPLIIIPQGERYLLWDGQRRWEAAKLLGWKTLRAVQSPMPKDLHRKALLTFIHQEDLNPLDKAEAIVKEISSSTEISIDDIPTVLSTVLRRLERQQQINQLTNLIIVKTDDQQQKIQALGVNDIEANLLLSLLDLGLNPASVKANLLTMLSLPMDLKAAIREQGLKGAHALALAVLSAKTLKISERQAKKERLEATQLVIEKNLTVAKTRELVTEIKAKYLDSKTCESKDVASIVRGVKKLSKAVMDSVNHEQLAELREILRKKITEIDEVLD